MQVNFIPMLRCDSPESHHEAALLALLNLAVKDEKTHEDSTTSIIPKCEVCGSFLVANDAVERTQSHVTGKKHVGYGLVLDFLAEQKAAKDKGKEEERLVRGKEADDKRKPREKESESKRNGSSDRERHRDRNRDRDGDRHRDRGRDHRKPYDRRSRSGREGRDRSRSRAPHGRSGHRRVSRSPIRQY